MNDYQIIEVHRKVYSSEEPDNMPVYIDANRIIAYEDGQVYTDNICFQVFETAKEISAQISDITLSPDWLKEQKEKQMKDEMLLYMVKKMLGVTDES